MPQSKQIRNTGGVRGSRNSTPYFHLDGGLVSSPLSFGASDEYYGFYFDYFQTADLQDQRLDSNAGNTRGCSADPAIDILPTRTTTTDLTLLCAIFNEHTSTMEIMNSIGLFTQNPQIHPILIWRDPWKTGSAAQHLRAELLISKPRSPDARSIHHSKMGDHGAV